MCVRLAGSFPLSVCGRPSPLFPRAPLNFFFGLSHISLFNIPKPPTLTLFFTSFSHHQPTRLPRTPPSSHDNIVCKDGGRKVRIQNESYLNVLASLRLFRFSRPLESLSRAISVFLEKDIGSVDSLLSFRRRCSSPCPHHRGLFRFIPTTDNNGTMQPAGPGAGTLMAMKF